MSRSYGNNQGGYPNSGNPYMQGPNSQSGNPYAQSGPGMPSGNSGVAQYPSSNPQQFGGNPYAQNSGAAGFGYPPQSGPNPNQGMPYPSQGNYPVQQPQGGPNPNQWTPHPAQQPQSGPYPPQGNYPVQQPQGGPNPNQWTPHPAQQPTGARNDPISISNNRGPMINDQRMSKLNQIAQRYEINPQIVPRLQALADCEVVVLCDDSGSMNSQLKGSHQTRWDELKTIVNVVVDICGVMDSNGVDVYFLNRPPIANVTSSQSIQSAFSARPNGLTPLVPAIRNIFSSKRSVSYEKKLLIIIATDGAPTNEKGKSDIGSFEAVLRNERLPQSYITFLACTDDLSAVNYLSNWDKSMPNLDVMDDYASERDEIQRIRGKNFPFSFGDYIAKALLGSMDPWFDSLDERN